MTQTTKHQDVVFVFGSNLAGRHGKGAALTAKKKWRAEYGVGVGRTGNAYAIPTKDERLAILPLLSIQLYVGEFIRYARANPAVVFYTTAFGTGLAGYKVSEILPLFGPVDQLPRNVVFTREWLSQ